MDGIPPQERTNLEIDFLEVLLGAGAIEPDSISMEKVRNWFPTRERDIADEIAGDWDQDDDIPMEYVSARQERIWVNDVEEAEEHLDDLRENPPWFRK